MGTFDLVMSDASDFVNSLYDPLYNILEHLDNCRQELARLHVALLQMQPSTSTSPLSLQEALSHHPLSTNTYWHQLCVAYTDFYHKLVSIQSCLRALAESVDPYQSPALNVDAFANSLAALHLN